MNFNDVIVIVTKDKNEFKYHMIPLDPVFKIFSDQDEKDHSKIDLNEDSILSP